MFLPGGRVGYACQQVNKSRLHKSVSQQHLHTDVGDPTEHCIG